MARLIGVDLPREKRVEIALTYIFGIGKTRSQQTLAATGIEVPQQPSCSGVERVAMRVAQRAQPLRVFDRSLRIVNRARPDHDGEPVVLAVQDQDGQPGSPVGQRGDRLRPRGLQRPEVGVVEATVLERLGDRQGGGPDRAALAVEGVEEKTRIGSLRSTEKANDFAAEIEVLGEFHFLPVFDAAIDRR